MKVYEVSVVIAIVVMFLAGTTISVKEQIRKNEQEKAHEQTSR